MQLHPSVQLPRSTMMMDVDPSLNVLPTTSTAAVTVEHQPTCIVKTITMAKNPPPMTASVELLRSLSPTTQISESMDTTNPNVMIAVNQDIPVHMEFDIFGSTHAQHQETESTSVEHLPVKKKDTAFNIQKGN